MQVVTLLAAPVSLFLLTSHADAFSAAVTDKLAEKGMASQTRWINMFCGRSVCAQWRELMARHPDRFVLAFDNVFAPHWSEQYSRKVAAWRAALLELPPDVAHEKAERRWRLPLAAK